MSSPAAEGPRALSMVGMTPRSDASMSSPSGLPADGDPDLLAINGHHFDLGTAQTVG